MSERQVSMCVCEREREREREKRREAGLKRWYIYIKKTTWDWQHRTVVISHSKLIIKNPHVTF